MGFGFYTQGGARDQGVQAPNDPQADAKRKGYVGDVQGDGFTISGDFDQKGSDGWNPSGEGYDIVHGWKQAGTSAWDKDVDRYRKLGADGMNRQGAQLDQTQANESRGLQLGGLSLMNTAAQGDAPSRAVELSRAQNELAARNALRAQGGARGPGAAVAAMNGAQTGAVDRIGQTNGQLTDMRGTEMARNQGELASAANAARGQDLGAATANAQLQAQQRQLNENRQENFERLGYDTRKTQGQAGIDTTLANAREEARIAANNREANAIDDRKTADTTQSGLTLLALGMGSDERIKRDVKPMMREPMMDMGSLSGLSRFMHGHGRR
jgi:hypothetical protein